MNVLLVDDQVLVTEANRRLVHWKELGVDEVFTASSAREAKKILETEDIAIMLADIEMPGEDGIALQKWQAVHFPDTSCIFLTSHSDFRYAQQAIHNGVFDYILQPAEIPTIEETVRRCIEMRTERSAMKQKSEIYEQEKASSVETLIVTLFAQKAAFRKMEDLRTLTDTHDRRAWFLPAVVCTAEPHFPAGELRQALETERLDKEGIFLNLAVLSEKECGILFYGKTAPPDITRFQTALSAFLTSSGADRPFRTAYVGQYAQEDLPERTDRLMRASRDMLIEPGTCFLEETAREASLPVPKGTNWSQWILRGDETLVLNQIRNLLSYAEHEACLSVGYLQKLIHTFLEAVTVVAYQKDFSLPQIFGGEKAMDAFLYSYADAGQMIDGIKSCLLHYRQINEEKNGQTPEYSMHDRIQDVIHYLGDNMSQMITRKEAAKHAMLSEDYFSRVFRKETGYGYNEFLIRQKIEYARKLLEETDMPVTIIASKVGYGNFNQFTQIFRKYTGETPSGLRKKSENR